MNEDNRGTPRRRVLKGAVAAFNLGYSTVACTARDISASGCRLLTKGSIAIPDTFELLIELDGAAYPCEVIWRKPTEIGVRFTGPMRKLAPTRVQVVASSEREQAVSLRAKPIQPRRAS